MFDLDTIILKTYLGISLLQIPVSGYNWEFWIEKALTVGVLIWIVRDMKQASKETSKIHAEQLRAKDEEHATQLKNVNENYREIIATITEQHKQQLEQQMNLLKLKIE